VYHDTQAAGRAGKQRRSVPLRCKGFPVRTHLWLSVLFNHAMLSFLAIWLTFAAARTLAGTSYFKLELTWGRGAPDGHERGMIFINGQYPGPLLDIQQGDWVEIEVRNRMPFNSTIHAHGILPAISSIILEADPV
jgi:FtsP/CotA-like multicopper oxidase with cupredoxin domain